MIRDDRRDMSAAEVSQSPQTRYVLYRHDARNDRDCDTIIGALLEPIEEGIAIVEELSDDEIGAQILLEFEIFEILCCVCRIPVAFWIGCYTNTESIAMSLSDMFDQIG